MSAPAHSRPFDLDAAKAGAPYCGKEGQHVEILKWDCNHPRYPLIGIICENGFHYPESWTADGTQASDEEIERRPFRDLVMLPLGFIDGKPVFVGDEFLWPVSIELRKASPDMAGGDWSRCSWPAPPKVYPETRMKPSELYSVSGVDEFWPVGALEAVATAALRHAIDAGQVVPVSKAKPGLRPHNPYTGQLRDPRDIESDPMGMLIHHPDEPLRAAVPQKHAAFVGIVNVGTAYGSQSVIDYISNAILDFSPERRAARDMAIAQAVRRMCADLAGAMGDLNLAAVIASIK